MPQNKWLSFKEYNKQLRVPYVIYADFESLLVPIHGCTPPPNVCSTTKSHKHIACGYSYVVVGPLGVQQALVYRGLDAAKHLLEDLFKEEEKIIAKLKEANPLQMTSLDWTTHYKATHCHICEKPLNGDKVLDHDHYSYKYSEAGITNYRGAAHNKCNMNFKANFTIPVLFHNLKGYDAHHLMSVIGEFEKEVNVIPLNMEKYLSFKCENLVFLDSFQFLPSSLDKLVNNLLKSGMEKFRAMHQNYPPNKVPYLLVKGVYPYSYMTGYDKFEETQLPSRSAFFNDLTNEDLSDSDYKRAQEVWKMFAIQTLGEYHDLYVKCDVLLLADVFESFRELSLLHYKLDPCNFYTSPALSWVACLKISKVELELLTDPDMHLMIEHGVRGGISVISHRHFKANNPYLSDYNTNLPHSYILYLDANNLYGWAMSQPLPTHNFRFLSTDEILDLNIMELDPLGEIGMILEIDMNYPDSLHYYHNDYPLAAESKLITKDMLSPYAKRLIDHLGVEGVGKTPKLVPNLLHKEKYVVHYRNLQLYVSLGMEVAKIHRVISFQQSPWMEPYIRFNTEQRKKAKTPFEKDFYKMLNNSCFGKSLENIRKHVNITLETDATHLKKTLCKPNVKSWKIFNENLSAVHLGKVKLLLNKPIYIGLTILDLSKTLMYDFHYNHIKAKYGDKAKLLLTDTDSLLYGITTSDVYLDMKEGGADMFDFSDYPRDHFLHSDKNKKGVRENER